MSSENRAILYSRVSTPQQAKLYSLSYQLDQERAYVNEMGFLVVAEFSEDKSGRKTDNRDQLEEACQMLERDEADILVVWKFDRLHRNYVNSVILRDRLRKAGKTIHYAQSHMVSGKTARERLPEDLQFILAEIEADEIAERTAMGRRRKAEEGGLWIGQNRPPYGYDAEGKGKNAHPVINEETAQVVRNIFNWFVYGDDGKPLTTRQIRDRLTALGIPTPTDLNPHYSHHKTQRYAVWHVSVVQRILKNTTYIGHYYHYQHKSVDGKVVFNPNKEEWVEVPYPPIIDEQTFALAQKQLEDNFKYKPTGAIHDYLVSRRIWCECGYKMRASASGSGWRRKDGSMKHYYYPAYRCPGRAHRDQVLHVCDMPRLSAHKVDDKVWEYIKTEIANPVILKRKLVEKKQQQQEKKGSTDQIIKTLNEQKSEIEEEMRRVTLLYANKQMPLKILDGIIAEQNDKLQRINEQLDKLGKKPDDVLTDEVIADLVAFSEDLQARLATVEKTYEGKRTVVNGLDIKITVIRKNTEIWLQIETLLNDKPFMIPYERNP